MCSLEPGRKYLPTAGVKGLRPPGQTGGQDVVVIGMEMFTRVTHKMHNVGSSLVCGLITFFVVFYIHALVRLLP